MKPGIWRFIVLAVEPCPDVEELMQGPGSFSTSHQLSGGSFNAGDGRVEISDGIDMIEPVDPGAVAQAETTEERKPVLALSAKSGWIPVGLSHNSLYSVRRGTHSLRVPLEVP